MHSNFFSQAQQSVPTGLNNISKITGVDALYGNFRDMRQDNDKYFHCKAHYESSAQGILGYTSSQIIGAGREISDMVRPDKWYKYSQGSVGSTYNHTKKDLEANKTGQGGGVKGKSCLSVCLPYVVPYINER